MDREDQTGTLRWYFNGCVLDESSLQLTVRGTTAELERKPLEVLRYLLRHAGEVVTKDEVLEAVWPGRILSDTVLAKAISRLREVLGEAASDTVKTVHGYGYRLVAEVRVEQQSTPASKQATLGLQRGDHPPLRPNWVLVAHLESGGRGEVWRVQHEKNAEQRVLKFALDESALLTLKREITLNRLLRQSLGEDAAVTPLIDWNLQQPPFFIELPYLPQGSLADWAQAAGGLSQIPLATRLDIAAQVAEAVSAAHRVGVLHKDLKPANVLVAGTAGQPRIQLTDFGSGGVLDVQQLDALGITRMGLTQALSGGDSTSGTPMYFAPEVLAGQPPTVRSDNYALGVLLYQLVAGDFKRPLSPGWERDISDALLREDIALAADGNPQHRLGDAEELARRLRQLESRRASRRQRDAEQAALALQQAESQKALAKNEQLLIRRRWQWVAIAALSLGLLLSFAQYRQAQQARRAALKAAGTAEAVSQFLADDLLAAADPARVDVSSLTVASLLDAAAGRVSTRFADDPLAAARVRSAIAASYYSLGQTAAAHAQIRLGWALLPGLLQAHSPLLPDVAAQLAQRLPMADAAVAADTALWREVYQGVVAQSGASDLRTLTVAALLANILFHRGDFAECFRVLEDNLARVRLLQPQPATLEVSLLYVLARASISVDRYPQAIAASQQALTLLRQQPPSEKSARVIGEQLQYLGRALRYHGQLAAADAALEEASQLIDANARADSEAVTELRWERLELHLMQGQWTKAATELETLRENVKSQFLVDGDNRTLLFMLSAESQIARGQNQSALVEKLRREQVAGFEALIADPARAVPRDGISLVVAKLGLTTALIDQGRIPEAHAVLDSLDPKALATFDVVPLNRVSLLRVRAQLAVAERQKDQALQAASQARTLLSTLCVGEHPWFAEIDALQASALAL